MTIIIAESVPIFAKVHQHHHVFWLQHADALIGLLGVLVGLGFGFWQWWRSYRAQKENERRWLTWERQRMELEDKIARERIAWEEQRQAAARRREAEEAMQARLREQAEHADTMERQAIAYRQALIAELRNLKILDMTKPLDLETLYVQLKVREDEPPRFVKDDDVATLASGDPEHLLRLSQVRLGERAALALTPEEALRRFNRIAVLGDPGAGKTTMLRHLAFRIARAEFVGSIVLPVYIELRRFVDSRRADLLDFVTNEWHERYGFVEARLYLEQELAAGRSALLLDGLDEVLGGETAEAASEAYDRVAREIDRLATRFPNAPIVVTCRRAGWGGKLLSFQTLEVLDFSWDQVQTFLKNWFADSPTKAEELRFTLAGNLRMQTLAANPLLLSLIAIVYERELELPERRAQLYSRCVEVLLKEWDSHRGIRRFGKFTTDRKRDLLEEVAWHFHRGGSRYFPKSDLLEVVEGFLPTIDLPPEDATAILDEIAAHYGLLKVQAHDWYGFLHLTLQEYFVAVAANERGERAVDEVALHRHDPWWEEVILLLAGRMADAAPLLFRLLDRSKELPPSKDESLVEVDDLFHADLILAARCLVGTPRIRAPWLRERIIAEMMQIFRTAKYRLEYEEAARVLTQINSEAISAELFRLLIDEKSDHDRRRAIVEAFGRSGDATVAPRILNLLRQPGSLDDYDSLEGSIAETLGLLRYRPALATLVEMLGRVMARLPDDANRIRYEMVLDKGVRIVRALGALTESIVVEQLIEVLRYFANIENDFVCRHMLTASLEALESSDRDVLAPELLHLLTTVKWASAGANLVKAIGSVSEAGGASELLAALLSKEVYGPLKPAIARTLRDRQEVSVVPGALRALRDRERPWETRWLLTEVLEGCEEASRATLRGMLDETDLDERVRVGIAATLGTWKESVGLAYLRSAIESALIPGDLTYMESNGKTYTYRAYFWRRIARVMRSLDDDWIVQSLLRRFDSAEESITDGSRISAEMWTILHALSDDPPAEIGHRVLSIIKTEDRDKYAPWEALSMILSRPLIPKVISLLEQHELTPRTRDDVISLVSAVAQVADDAASADSLLQMFLLASRQDSPIASAYYEALYEVCKRARVRPYPDGQIRPFAS